MDSVSPASLALGGGFFTTEPPGKSHTHTHTHTHTHLKGHLTVYHVFTLKISFNPQKFLGWLFVFFNKKIKIQDDKGWI